ncbi:phage filamentation protein Fil family protein [Edwardsiella tarda]|uniref:DUF2724 domain-containing protein n=1 Tax=Edwardsiella tarda ATCC 23685 TaxID=500638 RepID=D4F0Y6_EDWTA|nr:MULTISPECIES: phage filamentation protein Fil family protein [Edwardsiella]EFE24646.1 hypothetical protein EDWATA_00366 [Edwardsiella tarda ATCC 23685]ELM3658188.1 DUF2724 domain-containing protein [Edwardsiella piscicida]UBU95253.1 DUF2724 domain-containing protein [Edwardsiella tarda]UCQ41601.1 DUF2724 domain-containing protein [Edwardsiella piscicida]
MMTMEPSLASFLKKQSPSMHYGHGWITGENGKRWHPCRSQAELLASLSGAKQGESWLSQKLRALFR